MSGSAAAAGLWEEEEEEDQQKSVENTQISFRDKELGFIVDRL